MATNNNILQTTGKTPLVKLNSIPQNINSTIYAKVEYLNHGGSNKDRIALTMIEAAEKAGEANLVRLSVGIENKLDWQADLESALA